MDERLRDSSSMLGIKSIDGGPDDAVVFGDFFSWRLEVLDQNLDLLFGQFGFRSEFYAARLCFLSALPGPLPDQLPLELPDGGEC
jgi:hypothetical protein